MRKASQCIRGAMMDKEQFLSQHMGLIYRICQKAFRNRQDVEDAVQECALRLWRYIDIYDPSRAAETTFVYHIVKNCLRSMWSKENRRRPIRRTVEIPFGVLDYEDGPEVVAIRKEEAVIVQEAVKLLPERKKRIANMRYQEGLTFQEISAELGVSHQRVGQINASIERDLSSDLARLQ